MRTPTELVSCLFFLRFDNFLYVKQSFPLDLRYVVCMERRARDEGGQVHSIVDLLAGWLHAALSPELLLWRVALVVAGC